MRPNLKGDYESNQMFWEFWSDEKAANKSRKKKKTMLVAAVARICDQARKMLA